MTAELLDVDCAWKRLAGRYSCPQCDPIASYLVQFLGGDREVLICAGHVAWLRPLRTDILAVRGSRPARSLHREG